MQKKALIFLIILLGLIVRLFLVQRVMVGDLLAYLEWGEKIWTWGTKTYFFGQHPWYYSPPNYPPLSAFLFGGLDWLWQHKYITAQLHNLIRFPPAAFIIYFYKYGQVLLYKLLPILADLGLGIIIYKLVLKFTKSAGRALAALAFFVLNPVTIFISGAWGQTDSLVAFFGLLAFVVLSQKKFILSLFLFFVSMYLKPSWGILIPFYLWCLYLKKPSLKSILLGAILVLVSIFVLSVPFAEKGVIIFTKQMWIDKYIIPVKSVGKASVSAFNFHTIFLKVDRDFFNAKYLGLISANGLGLLAFIAINYFAFSFLKKAKNFLWGEMVGLFVVGVGSFLFMANMLERYFFPGLAPLIIIMFSNLRTFAYGVLMNLIFLANIIWSFYRRGSDEIDHPFTNNNFLLIRVLSISIVGLFGKIMLQFRKRV
jgi:Gpi18-like mannosyltransferase